MASTCTRPVGSALYEFSCSSCQSLVPPTQGRWGPFLKKGDIRCSDARLRILSVWPSLGQDQVGTHTTMISELNDWPEFSPVNVSPASSRKPAHDSGSNWFATPCLDGSCPGTPGLLTSGYYRRFSCPFSDRNKYAEGVTQPSPALLAQRATLGQTDLVTDLP